MTKPSDHDLLTRIDERQQIIKAKVESIEKCIAKTVTLDDSEYREMRAKVDSLWDSKNRVVGWIIGASIGGGFIGSMFKGLVTSVIASIQ